MPLSGIDMVNRDFEDENSLEDEFEPEPVGAPAQVETKNKCEKLLQTINEIKTKAEQYGVKVEYEQNGLVTEIKLHIPLKRKGLTKTKVEVTSMLVSIKRGDFSVDFMPPENVIVAFTDENDYPMEEYVFPRVIFTATIEDDEIIASIHYNDCEWFEEQVH